jgi:hypothetical protein
MTQLGDQYYSDSTVPQVNIHGPGFDVNKHKMWMYSIL